ncbi:MAG TPA: ribosome biogenesis GTP-binding protein YihA/YsxC [Gammaproteobacteria bacterium]|nr:ribosome biogenesis GTP-binding protein YihA/YsxC [Gammaproteobacteria bacterium]
MTHPDYRQSRFLTSADALAGMPPDRGREVAFAGRSNAGKSSVINALTGRRGLARTSKTPGRTRLLNFFELDGQRRLVDLPGYGYARVPEAMRRHWGELMEAYLAGRRSLQGIVLIMDARHPLREFDQQLLAWRAARGVPCHVLLSKSDKLGRGAASATLHRVRAALGREDVTVQLFSSPRREGVDELSAVLDAWLAMEETVDKKNPGG